MTLRNAFEAMATEATAAQLVEVLEGLHEFLLQQSRAATKEIPYARDNADSMLVNVRTGNGAASLNFGTTSNAAPAWFANGSPNSMDAREVQRDMSTQTFQQRRARWEIT
jgi:hypothetical protein